MSVLCDRTLRPQQFALSSSGDSDTHEPLILHILLLHSLCMPGEQLRPMAMCFTRYERIPGEHEATCAPHMLGSIKHRISDVVFICHMAQGRHQSQNGSMGAGRATAAHRTRDE